MQLRGPHVPSLEYLTETSHLIIYVKCRVVGCSGSFPAFWTYDLETFHGLDEVKYAHFVFGCSVVSCLISYVLWENLLGRIALGLFPGIPRRPVETRGSLQRIESCTSAHRMILCLLTELSMIVYERRIIQQPREIIQPRNEWVGGVGDDIIACIHA